MTTPIMKAKNDYIDKKYEALDLIKKIEQGIKDDEFQPEWGWANNGSMTDYVRDLKDISDRLHHEGEYAES